MAGGSGGSENVGCFMKVCAVICVACLIYLGWLWAEVQVHEHGRQPVPDVPDRTPCTVRCDRSGQGMP